MNKLNTDILIFAEKFNHDYKKIFYHIINNISSETYKVKAINAYLTVWSNITNNYTTINTELRELFAFAFEYDKLRMICITDLDSIITIIDINNVANYLTYNTDIPEDIDYIVKKLNIMFYNDNS